MSLARDIFEIVDLESFDPLPVDLLIPSEFYHDPAASKPLTLDRVIFSGHVKDGVRGQGFSDRSTEAGREQNKKPLVSRSF